jgi:hypothetical protein
LIARSEAAQQQARRAALKASTSTSEALPKQQGALHRQDKAPKRSAEMMDLVDFGPLHILMRDDNSRISMLVQIRDLSVDSDQLRLLGSAYLSQERVKPRRAQRVTTTALLPRHCIG